MGTLILIAGVCTAFNFIIVIWKLKKGRYMDFTLDIGCMIAICTLFVGSFAALAVGMIASMLISLYLLFSPIRLITLLRSLNPLK